MKILGIDSSGLVASVALMVDGVIVGEYTIHNKKTHSQTLLPMIDEMLEMAQVDIDEIDCVAVSAGPGSFTGLRIGAATAKGIAWTLEVPVVAVSSLMSLAANIAEEGRIVCPIMDARRSQVYYGIYRINRGIPEVIVEPDVVPVEEAARKAADIADGEKCPIFLGDGVPVYEEQIGKMFQGAEFVRPSRRYQNAVSLVELGEALYNQGEYVSAAEFAPVYLRKSQAEREREEAQKGKEKN